MTSLVAGIIYVRRNGTLLSAKGEFTYNLGHSKRTAVIGSDGVHGYKEEPQAAYIAGKITDRKSLILKEIVGLVEETITLELANGKTVVLSEAWYAGTGDVSTGEGEIDFRVESASLGEEF